MDDAEQGRVGADAERDRQHGDGGERRAGGQQSNAMREVAAEGR